MAGTIEEQLKELLEQRDGASAGRASAARPASPIPLGQPVQPVQTAQPVRKERAHKRIYMVMYEAIGLLGSADWPVACVMLLVLLTCAAMVVTGILRCILPCWAISWRRRYMRMAGCWRCSASS